MYHVAGNCYNENHVALITKLVVDFSTAKVNLLRTIVPYLCHGIMKCCTCE